MRSPPGSTGTRRQRRSRPPFTIEEGITQTVITNLESAHAEMVAAGQFAQTLPDYSSRRTYSRDELASAHAMMDLIVLQDFQMVTLLNASTSSLMKCTPPWCPPSATPCRAM